MKKIIAALMLIGCGGSDLPTTRCGLFVYGQTLRAAQIVEDTVERAFQHSSDPRLHSVCRASSGWTVVAEETVRAPIGADGISPGQAIGGYSSNRTHEIHTKLDLSTLPHELAHVAQGCDDLSVQHANWTTDVLPVLDLVGSGVCAEECP